MVHEFLSVKEFLRVFRTSRKPSLKAEKNPRDEKANFRPRDP
jgi:hypothetical protein